MADVQTLLRLIHATQVREPLPADLGPWLAGLALSSLSATEREAARNACLQRAAALVAGTRWAKMSAVRTELDAVRSEWMLHRRFPPPRGSITAHIVDALIIDTDTPSSISQLLRILKDDDD